MKRGIEQKKNKSAVQYSAKACAFTAVFVATVLASQFALSAIPGVEIVTLLFCAYAFAFGMRLGMLGATAFSLVRQLIFGFFPTVLILYMIYYNVLAMLFGWVGKRLPCNGKTLVLIVGIACASSAAFTLLDCVITPLWYGYSAKAMQGYFVASLPIMGVQVLCVGVSVGLLFLPLERVFRMLAKRLRA